MSQEIKKNDLYTNTPIPLPSEPLIIHEIDTVEQACNKIDRFFDDMIQVYSQATQELLKPMYYNDHNLMLVNSLAQGAQANWHFNSNDDGTTYRMSLDEHLYNSPIITRWNKIHEIACHIGQVHHRIEMVGLDQWLEEINDSSFNKFTELSVAPVEKQLLDALPESLIEIELDKLDDTPLATLGVSAQDLLAQDIIDKKNSSYESYTQLDHRKECHLSTSITDDEVNLVHSRPDVTNHYRRTHKKPFFTSIGTKLKKILVRNRGCV